MEKYILENNVKVFGIAVKNFPGGIGKAFSDLAKILPSGDDRSYYGIFETAKNGSMLYYATTEEKNDGEAEKYNCSRHIIEKGEYLTEAIRNWSNKTSSIKNVFRELIENPRADKGKPGIEWYKNDKGMLCMVKTIRSR